GKRLWQRRRNRKRGAPQLPNRGRGGWRRERLRSRQQQSHPPLCRAGGGGEHAGGSGKRLWQRRRNRQRGALQLPNRGRGGWRRGTLRNPPQQPTPPKSVVRRVGGQS